MKNYVFMFAIILIFIFTSGCNESIDSDALSADGKHAFNYLKKKGYKVFEFHEESSVVITKELLMERDWMSKWAAQSISPDNYINETITVHSFSVKKHPLEDIYDSIENPLEGVYVEVFVWNDGVIGGVSAPIAKVLFMGGYHQLDHMPSLMQIEGIDYPTWHSAWEEKYK